MKLPGTTIAAVLFTTTGAWAACEPFVVTSPVSGREAGVADGGEPGPGPGDRPFGRRGLVDANGNAIGTLNWNSHVLAVNGDGVPTEVEVTQLWDFDDGAIFVHGMSVYQSRLKDFEDAPAFDSSDPEITWTILGGTGAYAGASGTISAKADGQDLAFRVDVTCN